MIIIVLHSWVVGTEFWARKKLEETFALEKSTVLTARSCCSFNTIVLFIDEFFPHLFSSAGLQQRAILKSIHSMLSKYVCARVWREKTSDVSTCLSVRVIVHKWSFIYICRDFGPLCLTGLLWRMKPEQDFHDMMCMIWSDLGNVSIDRFARGWVSHEACHLDDQIQRRHISSRPPGRKQVQCCGASPIYLLCSQFNYTYFRRPVGVLWRWCEYAREQRSKQD